MSQSGDAPTAVEMADGVDDIRRDIERTQDELGGTIDAIQDKLSPGALLAEVQGPVEETTDHIVAEVQRAVRESFDHILSEARQPVEEMGDHLIERATGAVEEATERLVAKATAAVEEATDHILDKARSTATETASGIVEQTGKAVRTATIGKVEKMAMRVQHMGNNANETTKGLGATMIDTVRSNPLPASLAAIGLSWLYLKRPKTASYGYNGQQYSQPNRGATPYAPGNGTAAHIGNAIGGAAGSVGDAVSGGVSTVSGAVGDAANAVGSTVGDTASTVGDALSGAASSVSGAVSGAASTVGDAVSGAASTVGDTVGQVATGTQGVARNLLTEVQFQALRAGEGLQTLARTNPLALGAAGIAVGSLIGLAIPESLAEHKLMGGMRDAALDQAGETAQHALQKVEHVTAEAGHIASEIGHIAAEV